MSLLRHITAIPGVRAAWSRIPIGPLELRAHYGIAMRPHYLFGVVKAARLAKHLGLKGVSVIEFGVAGGRGLLALERVALEVGQHFDIEIKTIGFDTGAGMPPPIDFRDLPHVWSQGFYKMEPVKLQKKLQRAELHLGNVADTVLTCFQTLEKFPLGFLAFDLDYYSSTKDAFRIFTGTPKTRLPRVVCYFDDIIWPEDACHNEFTGELLAIREFNDEHTSLKITKYHYLKWVMAHQSAWNEQIYVMHDFHHPFYTKNITPNGLKHTQKTI